MLSVAFTLLCLTSVVTSLNNAKYKAYYLMPGIEMTEIQVTENSQLVYGFLLVALIVLFYIFQLSYCLFQVYDCLLFHLHVVLSKDCISTLITA